MKKWVYLLLVALLLAAFGCVEVLNVPTQTEVSDLETVGENDPAYIAAVLVDDETQNLLDSHAAEAQQMHEQMLAFLEELDCPAMSLNARREFNPTPRANIPHVKVL